MNRIRDIRLERAKVVPVAFSLSAVARRLGVAESTLRAWEQGAARPRQRHARQLAKELGVSVEDLHLEHASEDAAAGPSSSHAETELAE